MGLALERHCQQCSTLLLPCSGPLMRGLVGMLLRSSAFCAGESLRLVVGERVDGHGDRAVPPPERDAPPARP